MGGEGVMQGTFSGYGAARGEHPTRGKAASVHGNTTPIPKGSSRSVSGLHAPTAILITASKASRGRDPLLDIETPWCKPRAFSRVAESDRLLAL